MSCRCQQLLSVAMYMQHVLPSYKIFSTAVNHVHRSTHKLFPRYWIIGVPRHYVGTSALYGIIFSPHLIRGGADKSLAQPGKKQATENKFGIYSTHSPRSSIHFLARCSNFCRPLKKKSEYCPSNQVYAAAMTTASEEKWRPFNCFFSPGNRW